VVTVRLVLTGHADLGNVLLAGVVLFVAVYQAHVSVPGPAELWVERQYELEQSDLIFYRYADAPGLPEGVEQPADFLLQLDVAVANIGGRKALVSSLSLLRFIDEHGEAVRLPEVPLPIAAQRYHQRFRWVGRERLREAEITFPPLMLEPDEVGTFRFRARRGIDWSGRWTPDLLRQAAQSCNGQSARLNSLPCTGQARRWSGRGSWWRCAPSSRRHTCGTWRPLLKAPRSFRDSL
jgi:hypothetical protein